MASPFTAPDGPRSDTAPNLDSGGLVCPRLDTPRIYDMRLERIDHLQDAELEKLQRFPLSVADYVRQDPPTLPISAHFGMYTAASLENWRRGVEAQVGDVAMQVAVARATIEFPDGRRAERQPVHTVTTFETGGERFVGPLVGSVANPLLRFGRQPFEFKCAVVEQLITELIRCGEFSGCVIAFPGPSTPDPSGGPPIPAPERLPTSQAYRILCGERLRFSLYQYVDRSRDASAGYLYYLHGRTDTASSNEFLLAVRAIREVRLGQRQEFEASASYRERERFENGVRDDWANGFFVPFAPGDREKTDGT